ncbi:MAG: esterase/lipase family protein [Fusobacteriaceae bacterium]
MDYYRVLLVHGFFGSNRDMEYIASVLRNSGFRVDNLNLPLTFSDITFSEKIIRAKLEEISKDRFSKNSEIILIGYGMGGYLVRKVIHDMGLKDFFMKMIFIAAPTKTPKIIKINMGLVRVLSKIFKPLKIFLEDEIENLPEPQEELGIIRSTEPDSHLLKKYFSEYNDGALNSDEVVFNREFEIIDIPFGRKEVHKRPGTVEYIMDFIETGKFKHDKI